MSDDIIKDIASRYPVSPGDLAGWIWYKVEQGMEISKAEELLQGAIADGTFDETVKEIKESKGLLQEHFLKELGEAGKEASEAGAELRAILDQDIDEMATIISEVVSIDEDLMVKIVNKLIGWHLSRLNDAMNREHVPPDKCPICKGALEAVYIPRLYDDEVILFEYQNDVLDGELNLNSGFLGSLIHEVKEFGPRFLCYPKGYAKVKIARKNQIKKK